MKIGVLAYHSACNYGANLQLLSTIGYLRYKGYEPFVINYEAQDFIDFYRKGTPLEIYNAFEQFRNTYMPLTRHCSSAEEIAEVIQDIGLQAIIIGSDAVAQHHTLWERLLFPTRKIIFVQSMTSDRLFPNPFWGTFMDYLQERMPMALLSASSQDSNYKLFSSALKKQMWGTPDPVFAFNQNCAEIIPTKEEILAKYNLPENYILLSFLNSHTVSLQWQCEFQKLAEEKGMVCAALPFPQGMKFQHCLKYEIPLPLLPLDWYALIRYSQGYVGHNMHPIVVSLHNANPFFSFDNYGLRKFNGLWSNDYSSKIKHILNLAGLQNNRVSCLRRSFVAPAPQFVFSRLYNFKSEKAKLFAVDYLARYEKMMFNIINLLKG